MNLGHLLCTLRERGDFSYRKNKIKINEGKKQSNKMLKTFDQLSTLKIEYFRVIH